MINFMYGQKLYIDLDKKHMRAKVVCVSFILQKWVRTIESIYTIYECSRCRKESILITSEVSSTLRTGKYISCSHCGCKNLKIRNATDNFKECIDHSAYKKIKGVIRQVHSV